MDKDFYEQASPLLTAFDKVANSNSHLLWAPKKPGNLRQRFLKFVPSRAFKRLLCESDRLRDWHNFHEMDRDCNWKPRPGGFYNGTHIHFDRSLSKEGFARKLRRLLKKGPCFYGHRYPDREVNSIVRSFVEAFVETESEIQTVRPTFLFPTNYFGHHPPNPPRAIPYFDGIGCDHCWTWIWQDELLVLLLNGCD